MTTTQDPRKTHTEVDVAVIGSGIGGLSAAALLAHRGYSVTLCESHTTPGGAAHGFERDGFHFESGPSFFTGLSVEQSTNPLRLVLDQIGEKVEAVSYDHWNFHFPEGLFISSTDEKRYHEQLAKYASEKGMQEWLRLEERMIRPPAPEDIHKPFASLVDQELSDPFLRNLCDFDAFSLSGMDAAGTPLAEMHFMFRERFKASVDYPIGGSQAVVDALVRGLQKQGGKLVLGAHVDSVIVEAGRAVGIKLRRGGTVRARPGGDLERGRLEYDVAAAAMARCPTRIASSRCRPRRPRASCTCIWVSTRPGLREDLEIHHVVLKSWDVTAPQNMCNISIPSTLDPSMAPAGHHAIHAYTAGNEPYALWEGLEPKSAAYQAMKEERAEVLWQAMEKVIPDVRASPNRGCGRCVRPCGPER